MQTRAMSAVVVLAGLVACTTTSDPGTPVDAAVDAPATPVVALSSCPSSVAGTVTDTPTMFLPKDTTIPKNQIVKFVITAEHFVQPNTLTTTDPALMVSRGQTKCFQFNVPGTYGFLCGVHGFTGTITVQ
jgi:plastocyanin